MEPILHQGRLKTWNDDRGFGFIVPEGNGKDVFLHISAIKEASRRPQAGDIIYYQRVTEPNGKVRAAKASIQGVPPRPAAASARPKTSQTTKTSRRPQYTSHPHKQSGLIQTVLGFTAAIATLVFALNDSPSTSPSPIASVTQPNCLVKGNISISSGKKWYHVPGMEDYEGTVIDPSKGERWFCTEAEAISSGWQKAPK
ncbi:cold shock domain-containing protein [Pseudanabaena sp. FACHB-2040]|uniref:cold shock domain-containing protein n=1 Tax=Pseudanabaena sp. FACHB-2040 TaxID=2692859 RepID=UPI001684E243|nr:cold shock domain-containing protein [Pseudanabaena sp. FACHB-2040]MBD2258051.1 cold shock domain-containing protein [Pseudanabaena sp. FACHB-2040]